MGFQKQKPEGDQGETNVKIEENKEENISQASARSQASSKGSVKTSSDKSSEKNIATRKKICCCKPIITCCNCSHRN